MTNEEILEIAMRQSAFDSSCRAEDFKLHENKIVISKPSPEARRYLELPFLCDLTTYGSNIVASVSPELYEITDEYISKYPVEHCFETPNLQVFIDRLRPLGMNVCFMAEYFLPDTTAKAPEPCGFELKLLTPADFSNLYTAEWGNALCESRKHLDMLAVGAYDGDRLIGLAGASADCDSMWQIGVDVLPEYRRRGVASCVTRQLADEILAKNIVPFYCCAWSNIGSARNAVKSGFRPTWVQMTVKPDELISRLNARQ